MLFPASLVGSYSQPEWLIDRERLSHRFPPRARARERLVLAPDCGMKYLPREVAVGKLVAMTTAAAQLRAELG